MSSNIVLSPTATSASHSLDYLRKPKRLPFFSEACNDKHLLQINTDCNARLYEDSPFRANFLDSHNNNYTYDPPFKQKKRSLSLPALDDKASVLKNDSRLSKPAFLKKRSKSVHFDENLPIKNFHSDESPSEIINKMEFISYLNFQNYNKPLKILKNPKRTLLSQQITDNNDNTTINNKNKTINNNNKVMGFYKPNFPILSNKNPRLLKINIFPNLSSSYCFLQELSLDTRNNIVHGKILVRNISYHKRVVVKYTLDGWNTMYEMDAVFLSDAGHLIPTSYLQFDIFHFILADAQLAGDSRLQFCVRYETMDTEWWDNNNGRNYAVTVHSSSFI